MKNQFKTEIKMMYPILVGLPLLLLLIALVLGSVGIIHPKPKVTTSRPN